MAATPRALFNRMLPDESPTPNGAPRFSMTAGPASSPDRPESGAPSDPPTGPELAGGLGSGDVVGSGALEGGGLPGPVVESEVVIGPGSDGGGASPGGTRTGGSSVDGLGSGGGEV